MFEVHSLLLLFPDAIITIAPSSTVSAAAASPLEMEVTDGSGNILCVRGIEESQILQGGVPEGTRITMERMESGEEAYILHIDDPDDGQQGQQVGVGLGNCTEMS